LKSVAHLLVTLPTFLQLLFFPTIMSSVSSAILDSFWASARGAKKLTQLERYEAAGAADSIIKIIRLGGGPAMGTTMEKIARHVFAGSLMPRARGGASETGYDHIYKCADGRTLNVEQKSAGLWSDAANSFRWQHIEADHKWDVLLLAGIQHTGIDFWGMRRADFLAAVAAGAATNQGNKSKDSSEGVWMDYAGVAAWLVPIKSKADFEAFAASALA
jgi:hypothetical protein